MMFCSFDCGLDKRNNNNTLYNWYMYLSFVHGNIGISTMTVGHNNC